MQTANPVTSDELSSRYHRALHWCALAVVVSTFPLIWMGGLVTTKAAGLSVPDWPNSYGYNMFLFPPSRWLGGIFYEHTHRLLGTLSGFLAIALVLAAWAPGRDARARQLWTLGMAILTAIGLAGSALIFIAAKPELPLHEVFKQVLPHLGVGLISMSVVTAIGLAFRQREPRRWVRWLAVGVLAAVCVQGLLGGLRVDLVNIELAMIHGCFAQLFLCLAALMALATSRWWVSAVDRSHELEAVNGRFTTTLAALCVGVIFCQLVIGAIMRHNGAGLAIPDLPLAYGKVLPPISAEQLDAANAARAWTYHLAPVSLTQIWMHFTHRLGALAVVGAVSIFNIYAFTKLPPRRAIRRVAAILGGLMVVQFSLGALTVWLNKPADLASMHVAVGALTLMTASLAVAVGLRVYGGLPVAGTKPLAQTNADETLKWVHA